MAEIKRAARALASFMRRRGGSLTDDLHKQDAGFGLGRLPTRLLPDAVTTLVCGFCSTGCGLRVHLRKGEAINLSPDPGHPVNRGSACPKGWEALAAARGADRASMPLLRNGRGALVPVDWETAVSTMVERFKSIQDDHGEDSLAFLGTGQIATEEMALLGALAKFGMGIVHGDGNTRQCMATAVTAYKESFGFDAPPYTYRDFEESDVIVLVGSNLCSTHPIMWERISRNPHKPEIIVMDPRMTETAMAAGQHVPLRPQSDLTFLYGAARLLIERGWVDHEYIERHTEGFEGFATHVEAFSESRVGMETGLPIETLRSFVERLHRGRRVSFWWTMGVNQSHQGVRTAQAIINLALMTGNIGRPGTGANSITGQCNAMGSRLYSNTTSLFGGRDFRSAEDRNLVADILGIDAARIPSRDSWPYERIVEGIVAENVRGLWVVATNSAHSWINQLDLRDALDRLDFLVVQDMYATTETAELADLVLPAAGWGEKDGTFINSERRIGLIKKVARAPGSALADFHIFHLVAEAWGCGEMFQDWKSPEAVFQTLKRLSEGQPCDISGIDDYAMLDEHGGVQWPHRSEDGAPESERRLFTDGRFHTPTGRARFVWEEPRTAPERATGSFPLTLLTGRGSSAQWHTQTRTAKSPVLAGLSPGRLYVEINPADARQLRIRSGDPVRVASKRGRLRASAFVTPCVQRGQVFIPMHYPETNRLTFAAFDPYSRQPAYKAAAVAIHPLESWEA